MTSRTGFRPAVRPGTAVLAASGAALVLSLTACGAGTGSGSAAPATMSGTAAPAVQGSQAPTGTSGTGGTTPVSSSSTGSSGTSGTSGSSSSNGGTASSTRCHTGDVKATVGPDNPGAGQEGFPVVLTNVSGHSCTVYGFPGIAFQDSAHHNVTPDPIRTNEQHSVVTLAPGGKAWAPLTFSNPEISGAATTTPAVILITPPDERASLTVTWNGGVVPKSGNSSQIQIGPFSPGDDS